MFQWAMDYSFHDIKHIVEPSMENIPSHSKYWNDHLMHLWAILLWCRYYNIRLNPHKCVFYVSFGWILSFISNKGIIINPLKVQKIMNMHAPSSLVQLQRLQGKANFLWWFVPNYVELTKWFTHILKKGVPFHWDNETYKFWCPEICIGSSISTIPPPNYQCDYFLYLIASISTIEMVLVQEHRVGTKKPIYYLSENLNDTKFRL